MDLKENVFRLLEIENQIKHLKQNLDDLKNQKTQIENSLKSQLDKNGMKNKNIIFNDKKISYVSQKNYETFSKKYLLETLKLYLKNENVANEVTNFLYSNRKVNENYVIKISDKKK